MPQLMNKIAYMVNSCSCYEHFHCPSRTEWTKRANWNCSESSRAIYTCLFNVFKHKYEEACKYTFDKLNPGEQYIISHLPRGEKCKTGNAYQPFSLGLNMSSECMLRKSMCNGEGQVLFYNGSSREDRSCRCNFENGYAFVNRPQHPCKCTPTLEDCSCYKKPCPLHFKLTHDYSCIHNDNRSYISPCPDMVYRRPETPNATSNLRELIEQERSGTKRSEDARVCGFIILSLIVVGILAFTYICVQKPGIIYAEISAPYNFKVIRDIKTLQLSWSKPRKGSDDIKEYRITFACNSIWEKEPFKVNADSLCFHITSEELNFHPRTIYRFKISAYISKLVESKTTDEITYEIGMPAPQNFDIDGTNGTITLVWSKPGKTVLTIDKYKLDITKHAEDSIKTAESVVLSAETFRYVIENAQHKIYYFKLYSGSNDCYSDSVELAYNGNHAYHVDMKFQVDLQKQNERIENLQKLFREVFENGTRSIQGEQEIIYDKVSKGSLLLELVFTSRHFYDENELQKTIKNAFESNVMDEWEIILEKFSFRALNNPYPPQSIKAFEKDNTVSLTWKEPKLTFFTTEYYIVHVYITEKHGSLTHAKNYDVPVNQMSYSVSDVLPSTTIEFTIYTGICHSIKSYGSDMTCICVEGPTPPQDVKAINKDSGIEISWKKPFHPISKMVKHFKIKVLESQTKVDAFVSGHDYVYMLPNCKPMTNYSFELCTLTTNGLESNSTDTIEIQTRGPSPPQYVQAKNAGSSIMISWAKPLNPVLTFVKQFKIKVTENQTSFHDVVSGDEFNYELLDCKPFTYYSFQLFTLTSNDCESLASETVEIQTQGPSPPKDVRAANKGPSIEISWTKPLHPILKFVKQFKIKITENKTSFDDIVRGDEFTYKLLNCKPSTCYSFQLFTLALNECESRASETVEIQTQGPTPPQDVKATSKDSSIKLSWTKPVLPILRFVKQFKIRIVEDKTIYAAFVNGDEFMLELSNCKPLTNYSFQLSTITSNELESQATEAIEMQTKENALQTKEYDWEPLPLKTGGRLLKMHSEYDCAQVPLKTDQFTLTSSFLIPVTRDVEDVKLLQSGKIVLCERYVQQLITCSLSGEEIEMIPINGYPRCIAVENDWIVAVSYLTPFVKLRRFEIAIVDIQKLQVIRNIGEFPCITPAYSCPIVYAKNELYVHARTGEIVRMNESGDIQSKIFLSNRSITFSNISYDKRSNTMCGMSINGESLISVEKNGMCKTIYTFPKEILLRTKLAIDNRGNYLAFCSQRYLPDYKVYRISTNGQSCEELISSKIDTNIVAYEQFASFCIQNSSKTIVIIRSNVGHVYKCKKIDERSQ